MHAEDRKRLAFFMAFFLLFTIFNLYAAGAWIAGGGALAGKEDGTWSGTMTRIVFSLFLVTFPLEVLCLFDGFFVEGRFPRVTRHLIRTRRIPRGERVRFVHLSDLHVDRFGLRERLLVRRVRRLSPDMILVSGDYANTSPGYTAAAALLGELSRTAPLYLVAGNVETGYPEETNMLKRKFTFLESGVTTLRFGGALLHLVGCDDGRPGYAAAAAEQAGRGPGFAVLLYHKPDLARETWVSSFDLYLCGHTHGGQVRLPFYGAVITLSRLGKAFEAGPYALNGTLLYVNRGYGFEGGAWFVPRVRFLCRPEIAYFVLEGSGEDDSTDTPGDDTV